MNKKSQFGIAFLILIGFFLISGISTVYSNYLFNKNIGDYCKLSYASSSIDKKIEYFDKCSELLVNEDLKGYSAWWFYKPINNVKNSYEVMFSLQSRLHDLKDMDRTSFQYQTGMQQVEDELEYFVNGNCDDKDICSGSMLSRFSTAYCYKISAKYICW